MKCTSIFLFIFSYGARALRCPPFFSIFELGGAQQLKAIMDQLDLSDRLTCDLLRKGQVIKIVMT
jgi:hypothetical protein